MGRSILFLMSGLGVGGAELHTLGLRAGVQADDVRTTLVAHGTRRAQAMERRPGAGGAIQLNIRGMSSLRGWWRVWRLLRSERPDLVVAVNQSPLIVAIVARLLGATAARIACIYHTTILRPGDERTQGVFRWAVGRSDALVYVSERQASYWRARGLLSRRDVVIQNGVDLVAFRPDRAARAEMRAGLGIADGDFVIGVVASLWAEKNHLHVVEAVAALQASGVAARAVFVGDGPMRTAIEQRARALGIEARVAMIGDVEDVQPYIAAFDVGVLASVAVETFSLAALECLACGVPMVMSDIGGAAEIVEDGVNGRLLPPGDLPTLVAALSEMAVPAYRARLAAAARGSVERYSVERMLSAYRALFASLGR